MRDCLKNNKGCGMKKRLVVGVSGASGAALAVALLEAMQAFHNWETHLTVSRGARDTLRLETMDGLRQMEQLAHRTYPVADIGAAIASGTFTTQGMVIIPCSMKTLAGVAHGYSDNLLLRAADVTIKERRKLVLVARETPLSPIHLRNMTTLTEMGAVLMPPVLTFYNQPRTIADMVDHMVGKVLNEFGLEFSQFRRWKDQDHESKNPALNSVSSLCPGVDK
jgi:polyprenyl P-hydroxybenzoate/phenylacrylic acid decarboxylase-like protein